VFQEYKVKFQPWVADQVRKKATFCNEENFYSKFSAPLTRKNHTKVERDQLIAGQKALELALHASSRAPF